MIYTEQLAVKKATEVGVIRSMGTYIFTPMFLTMLCNSVRDDAIKERNDALSDLVLVQAEEIAELKERLRRLTEGE